MKRLATLTLVGLLAGTALRAQTSDLIFFTDDGLKFTLIIDGEQKNDAPATRVVATGIRNETPMCVMHFADKAIPDVKNAGWFPMGKEYTVMVTTNKKGQRVFRTSGEAELGTAGRSTADKVRPENFQEDAPVRTTSDVDQTSATQSLNAGGTQTTTTTTVTEGGTDAENVNLNMGVNGVGVNMNMSVNDGMGGGGATTTTHTTTTTTSTHTVNDAPVQETQAISSRPAASHSIPEQAYSMPGYSGKVGCPWPMNGGEFEDAKGSITSKSFEESKMTLAKQIAGDRCMTVDQVKGIMGLFSFEDSKLDFAKFAYDHTYDISNYYKVNDAFSFESSIDELNQYVRSR